MAGYEANARVTADVSQYVAASREAARASGTFGAAVRELRNDLQRMERTARAASEAVRPFGTAMRESTSTQRQAARAADHLSSELRTNAQAFETGEAAAEGYSQTQQKVTSSGRTLANQLVSTEDKLHQVYRAMALGTESSQDLENTTDVLSQRLIELRRRYDRLSESQQEAVDSQVALRRAEQSATEAGREATRTTRQLNAARQEQVRIAEQARIAVDGLSEQERHAAQMTEAALRSMAREMERVSQQREALMDLSRRQNGLDDQQEASLRALENRLSALGSQYNHLNAQQREVVDSSRRMAQAAQDSAQAVQQLGRRASNASGLLEHLSAAVDHNTGRLFALNAMLTDVEMGFMSMVNAAQRAGRFLYETFSAQEMATAHLARVTQETDTYVANLADTVEELSERIPVPFEELARIGVLGAQVGVADEHLSTFIETVSLFTATTDVAQEEAALLFARITEMTDIEETEVENLGAAVSELGSNAAATEQEILTATESIATVGTQAGLSKTSILGMGSALASLRVRPELARGAIQRVFVDLQETVDGAGEGLQRLGEITGMTGGELQELSESNTEEFFFRVLEGLGGVSDEGENLIPILREIGIINTRDADVIARLAGNYDFLEEQLNRANTSFSEGTFLQQESARLFDTLTARVETFINTWKNFLSDAVQAIAPFLISVVETGQEVGEFLDQFGNVHQIVGWTMLLGGAAAGLALLGAGIAGTVRGLAALRNVMNVFSTALATYTGQQTAAATATTRTSAAMTRLATTAGYARVGMGALVSTLGGLAAFGAAITAVGLLGKGLDSLSDSTEEYNTELLESQEAHHQAAGGMESLRKALEADSESWRRSREAMEEYAKQEGMTATAAEAHASRMADSFALRLTSTQGLTEEQQKNRKETRQAARAELEYEQSMHGSLAVLKDRRSEMEGDTSTIDANIAKQEDLKQTIEDNADSVERQTVAVGLATYEWQQASAESALLETGLLKNASAMEELEAAGIDLGETMRTALAKEATTAGDGVEYLDSQIARLRAGMGDLERLWDALGEGPGPLSFLGVDVRSETEKTIEQMEKLRDNVESNTVAIEEASKVGQVFADTTFEMSEDVSYTAAEIQELGQQQAQLRGETSATVDEIMEMGASAAVMDMEIDGLGMTVRDVADAFGSFVDPLGAWKEAQDAANQSVIDADDEITSLTENAEVSFNDFLDIMDQQVQAQQNWAANLLRVANKVPPEVLAGLTDMGVEGADIVQGLADANDEQVDRFVADWQHGGSAVLDDATVTFSSFLVMASEAGDDAGREFALNLYEQYQEGSISWTELTDQLTEYAEEEFQGADTKNEPELISQPAINAMNDLTAQLERINDNADMDVEPELETSRFWDEFTGWWSSVWDWWRELPSQMSIGTGGGGSRFNPGVGFADGGWVNGEGGPRADKIPIMASDDEFVVNASSARQFAPLLEWINSQHSSGVGEMNVPNFVPEDLLRTPRRPLSALNEHMPEGAMRSQSTPQSSVFERVVVNVNNQYPQAEPTSTTVNRSLQYAAALDGLG